MNRIHWLIRLFIHHFGNLLRWAYISYLRATGVKIGCGCMISLRAKIDTRRGKVFIGDNCTITYGCVILSHDGSSRQIDPTDDGEGTVVIEDDVFIGVNSVVLRNVTIGHGSVIGAGSVITGDIPSGVVAMGNPARIVKRINTEE